MLMKDTGGTSDGRILFMVEGRLLRNLMKSYKLRNLHLEKGDIYHYHKR